MIEKNDKVRFKDELVKERKLPPYLMRVTAAYVLDEHGFFPEEAYDLEDTVTGEKYIAIPKGMLVKIKAENKADSENSAKTKKPRFRIRKSMFTGMWFLSVPIVLIALIVTDCWWVLTAMLIPLAVGIFGADD